MAGIERVIIPKDRIRMVQISVVNEWNRQQGRILACAKEFFLAVRQFKEPMPPYTDEERSVVLEKMFRNIVGDDTILTDSVRRVCWNGKRQTVGRFRYLHGVRRPKPGLLVWAHRQCGQKHFFRFDGEKTFISFGEPNVSCGPAVRGRIDYLLDEDSPRGNMLIQVMLKTIKENSIPWRPDETEPVDISSRSGAVSQELDGGLDR